MQGLGMGESKKGKKYSLRISFPDLSTVVVVAVVGCGRAAGFWRRGRWERKMGSY